MSIKLELQFIADTLVRFTNGTLSEETSEEIMIEVRRKVAPFFEVVIDSLHGYVLKPSGEVHSRFRRLEVYRARMAAMPTEDD